MLIVLDTTETFSDLRMEGANYTFLRSFVSRNPVKLVVPQIVIEETVNHFRESLTRHLDEVRVAIRSLKRLIPDASLDIADDLSIEGECDKYREHLKKQLLRADQASYGDVDVTSLVQRALARRKPFDPSGKVGFRDAVLWETILERAQDKPGDIVLVTRNKKDFGEHGQLHEHLVADVKAKGLSNGKITICEGLSRFIDEHVKPSIEKLDEIQRQINEDEFPGFDAMQFFDESRLDIVDALRDHVCRVDINHVAQWSVYDFSSPTLGATAESIEGFQVSDVWRVDGNLLGIGIDYELQGSIECLKEAAYDPYERPYDEEYRDDVEFKLIMTVIIEEKSGNVDSWELNEIEVEPTGNWGIPDYDD